MDYKDYYKIMGVARGASPDEVKRAYRRLARKYHPDVSKERNAEERFKQVSEAYEVLSNPAKRSAYDALGRQRPTGRQFGSAWDSGFGFGRGRMRGTLDFGELFESLFSGAGLRMAREQFFEHRARDSHFEHGGEEVETTLTLTLEEAFKGVTKRLAPARPVSTSAMSRLHIRPRTVRVQVPPGAVEGQRIRVPLPGRGQMDLLAVLRFAPHPYFRAHGRDIHLELPLLPWEAALGATVQTPTLGGLVDLRIPRGSQSGHKLRLRARGLPGTPPGDQLVQLQVVAPPAVTAEAEALYRRMAETMTADPRAHFGDRR